MAQIHELEAEIARLKRSDEPILLCGDFNNSPTSTVYEYMQNMFLRNHDEPMRSAYDSYLLSDTDDDGMVMDLEKGHQGGAAFEPPFTTVNYRRRWTIDYIWYSSNTLRASKLLKIPSEAELRREEGPPNWLAVTMAGDSSGRLPCGLNGNHNGIPNSVHGSDHVPIMAVFEVVNNNP